MGWGQNHVRKLPVSVKIRNENSLHMASRQQKISKIPPANRLKLEMKATLTEQEGMEMINRTAHHLKLHGSSYEVGQTLGKIALSVPGLAKMQRLPKPVSSRDDETTMYRLFDEFCPGVNEEVAGFADVLKIPTGQVLYYLMTYLRPGCSQMTLLSSKTTDGHAILARNYDFSDQVEEMTLYTTKITGKHAHIGSSLMMFGRGDGMNEWGLAVSQTSAGFPVGNMEFARKPAITGLQFWAAIRAILENCKDVDEAVKLSMDMPIAYNINLLVVDRREQAALIESFDGHKAVKRIDGQTNEQYLCSTNHVHLPELIQYDAAQMKNSSYRYDLINRTLKGKEKFTKGEIQQLLSRKYPEGLCCHYYDQFFGTLRSMIFDVTERTVDVCFGSPALNRWYTLKVDEDIKQADYPVQIEKEQPATDFFTLVKAATDSVG